MRAVPVACATEIDVPSTFTEGRVLAKRYRLESILGQGGWATVYRARDLVRKSDVALKLLTPERRADAAYVERFLGEARTLTGLHHPHVVTVLDCGQSGRSVFIVMELLAGRALSEMIAVEAPLVSSVAVTIALQMLEGLAAAHDRGIVHRDLKPDNVLLEAAFGPRVLVKLGDFGIARSLVEDLGPEGVNGHGGFFGTPAYMSPEQARGEPADARSDLYAVGLCLYEMLAGEPAFPLEAALRTMQRRQHGPPPILPRVRSDPSRLEGLRDAITRLLAVSPADRPRDARAASRLLEPYGDTAGQTSRVSEPTELREIPSTYAPLDLSPPFCGRDADLARLLPAVRRLGDHPHATLIVLLGPHGLGKSRLASHLADVATTERGGRVFVKECLGDVLPLREVASVLEALLGTRPLDDEALRGHLTVKLAREGLGDERMARDLARLLRPGPGDDDSQERHPEAYRDRQHQRYHVLLDTLAHEAKKAPLVLVLDDLQAADALTKGLVARTPLWSRDRGRGLLVIATLATDGQDLPVEILRGAERFSDRVLVHTVGPLPEAEADALLRAIGPLDREARALVARLAGGTPQHALDVVRHFAREHLLVPTRRGWRLSPRTNVDLCVPRGVASLAQHRTLALRRRSIAGAGAADLLERAALVGDHVPLDLLSDILRREGRLDLIESLPAHVDLLVADGLLRLAEDEVVFDHALLRGAVAAAAAERPEAGVLHRVIADAMQSRGSTDRAAIALHLLRGGAPARALPEALKAAALFHAIGDVARAHRAYQLALQALDAMPARHASARQKVYLGLAETLLLQGQPARAEEWFLRALDASESSVALEGLGKAAEVKGEYDVALQRLTRAETLYRKQRRRQEVANVTIQIGRVLERKGDLAAAKERFERAVRCFDELADVCGAARARMALGFLGVWTGEHESSLVLLEEALRAFEAIGEPLLIAECLNRLASLRARMDDESAADLQRRASDLFERAGFLRGVAGCLQALGMERARLAAYADGERLIEASLRLREDIEDGFGVGVCLVNLGWLCRRAGKLPESAQWLGSALAHYERLAARVGILMARLEMAHTALAMGDTDAAEGEYRRVLAQGDDTLTPRSRGECLEGLASVERARGNTATSIRHCQEAIEVYRRAGLVAAAAVVGEQLATLTEGGGNDAKYH